MIPQILQLGPLPINSFGLMIALALLVGIYVLQKSFRLNEIPSELAETFVLVGGFVGLVSARLWYIVDHWSETGGDLVGALTSGAGFTFYGGFIASFLSVIALTRYHKLSLASVLDSLGPTLALGYAIGRLGCQLSGDGDYGYATDSFWGMSYATGVVPTTGTVRALATPLFESAMSVGILVFLLGAEASDWWRSRPYSRAGLYLILISIERFIVEFMRIEPRMALGFSEAQWIAMGLVVLGLGFVSRGRRVVSS